MLFEKQKICITKIPLENLICFYGKYHKSLIMSEVFYKKKEFTIVQLAHQLSRVQHHVCLRPRVYSKLTNSRRPCPPPPPPQYSNECPYV